MQHNQEHSSTSALAKVVTAALAERMLAPGEDIAAISKQIGQFGGGARLVSLSFGLLDSDGDSDEQGTIGYVLEVEGSNRNLVERLAKKLQHTTLRNYPVQVVQSQGSGAVALAKQSAENADSFSSAAHNRRLRQPARKLSFWSMLMAELFSKPVSGKHA